MFSYLAGWVDGHGSNVDGVVADLGTYTPNNFPIAIASENPETIHIIPDFIHCDKSWTSFESDARVADLGVVGRVHDLKNFMNVGFSSTSRLKKWLFRKWLMIN